MIEGVRHESASSTLVRIEAPHFVAGVVVGVRAAPIVAYMTHWRLGQILAYCARKGWRARLF